MVIVVIQKTRKKFRKLWKDYNSKVINISKITNNREKKLLSIRKKIKKKKNKSLRVHTGNKCMGKFKISSKEKKIIQS